MERKTTNEAILSPREKIEERGAKTLSDKELLMLLLGQGSAGHPVEDVAKEVIAKLDEKRELKVADLKYIPGMGSAKAAAVIAAVELGRRKNWRKQKAIRSPGDAYEEVKHYSSREQENLIAVSLNGAKEIIGEQVITIGTIDKTLIHPREVFAFAIEERAAAVIIAHNHPSGNLTPSADDRKATKRIAESGEILGVKLIDHMIFSSEGYYSFLEHGDLK